MGSAPIGIEESGEGSFLWLAPFAPPKGWTGVPRGGMCLCAFLFVVRGEKILLGKYADHPAWENLSGMESKRVRANARGWTIPASHLKFGEDPRDAARRIGEEILTLDKGLVYSEPSVTTFFYEPAIAPGKNTSMCCFSSKSPSRRASTSASLPGMKRSNGSISGPCGTEQFARQHEDVAEAWLKRAGRHGKEAVIH